MFKVISGSTTLDRNHIWSKTYLRLMIEPSAYPNPNPNSNPNTNPNPNPNPKPKPNSNPNPKAQLCFRTDEMTHFSIKCNDTVIS